MYTIRISPSVLIAVLYFIPDSAIIRSKVIYTLREYISKVCCIECLTESLQIPLFTDVLWYQQVLLSGSQISVFQSLHQFPYTNGERNEAYFGSFCADTHPSMQHSYPIFDVKYTSLLVLSTVPDYDCSTFSKVLSLI